MSALTIRPSGAGDVDALARLAALDSARPLAGEILLAEVDGQLRAALSRTEERSIADPFHPTAELVGVLHLRDRQLRASGTARRRGLRRARPAPQPAR